MISVTRLTSVLTALSITSMATIAGDMPAHQEDIDFRVREVTEDVIAWRRDIHEHPELSNRETRTSALVVEHLKNLGLEVRTGIAHTGVVTVLRGGKPGKTVALRADMDALPVTEQVDVCWRACAMKYQALWYSFSDQPKKGRLRVRTAVPK